MAPGRILYGGIIVNGKKAIIRDTVEFEDARYLLMCFMDSVLGGKKKGFSFVPITLYGDYLKYKKNKGHNTSDIICFQDAFTVYLKDNFKHYPRRKYLTDQLNDESYPKLGGLSVLHCSC